MENKLASSHKLIFEKIVNRTHSHTAFSKYVLNTMLNSYTSIVMNVYCVHAEPVVEHNYC